MKVYRNGAKEQFTVVHVQPGTENPHVDDWMQEENDGKGSMVRRPRMFAVQFKEGCADVDKRLGDYMLDKGYAEREKRVIEAAESGVVAFDQLRPAQVQFTA